MKKSVATALKAIRLDSSMRKAALLVLLSIVVACAPNKKEEYNFWHEEAACGAAAKQSDTNNPFARLVEEQVPIGTPIFQAQKTLAGLGLECSSVPIMPGPVIHHYCDKIVPKLLSHWRWVVSIELDSAEAVTGFRTSCSATSL